MARKDRLYSGRRSVLKGLGAGIAGVSLAGCTGGGDGGGGGSTTSGSELTDVAVVTPQFGLWPTTMPWMVADQQGFYEDEGLSVERLDGEGGGANIRTVVGGDAQFGTSTGMAGMFAAFAEGTGIRIVGNATNQSDDLFWYGLSDEIDAEGPEDIDGLSIGFSRPGSSTNMVALTAANEYGAEAVSVGGPPDANAAVEGGEVDLGWSAGQFFFQKVLDGTYTEVFRGGEIEPFGNMTIRGHFVSRDVMENDRELAESYFSAHSRAIDWAYDNLEATAEMWGEILDQDDTQYLLDVIDASYPKESHDPSNIIGLDDVNQIAVDFDFVDEKLTESEIDELVDTSVLPG